MQRLDREKYGALKASLRSYLVSREDTKRKHPGERVIGNTDFIPQMSELHDDMFTHQEKVLVLSPKTEKRIDEMNIDSLLKRPEAMALLLKGYDFGTIISHRFYHAPADNLNATYSVRDGKFYLHLWSGEYTVGYIVIDPDELNEIGIYPHHYFTMHKMNTIPHDKEEKIGAAYMRSQIMADYGEIPDPQEMKKNNKYKKHPATAEYFEYYYNLYASLLWIFKCFVFLRTSEVYSKEYVPDPTPTFRRKKGYRPLNYTYVDSTWDMNIDVNNPFPVRGHFVNQVCKINGEWGHKLIYVDQYMKTGYHRRAKKTIIENEK